MFCFILGISSMLGLLILHFWASRRFNSEQGLIEFLLKMTPMEMTGSNLKIRHINRILINELEMTQAISEARKRNMKKYLLIWLLFSVLLSVSGAQGLISQSELTAIERPEFGDEAKKIEFEVQAENGGVAIKEHTELSIKPKKLSLSQKQFLLQDLAAKLPTILIGENQGMNQVHTNLNLITEVPSKGIKIKWQTSNPEIIRDDGFVDVLNLTGSVQVILNAALMLDEIKHNETYIITVSSEAEAEDRQVMLRSRLNALIDKINTSAGSESLSLPATDGDGVTFKWLPYRQDHTVSLFILLIFSMGIIFRYRYARVEKTIRNRQEAIIREFPYFISKFILLLNAGLVVSTALHKITEDFERYYYTAEQKPLYEDLSKIQARMRSTNGSLGHELRKYAEQCGIREMLRFASIVSDNLDKGSTLAEKLEAESSLLWHNRKKRAEELGRLADTKLILPLLILLLILIMVTIAPALIAI